MGAFKKISEARHGGGRWPYINGLHAPGGGDKQSELAKTSSGALPWNAGEAGDVGGQQGYFCLSPRT